MQDIPTPTVLIAEDDDQLRILYRYKLEEEGFRVMEAASGQDAIDIYHQHKPGLILMDAVMPGINGFDACRQILAVAGDEEPIVLIATALDDEKSVNKAFQAGAADYVTKPIHWAVLANRLKYLLNASHAEQLKRKLDAQQSQAEKMAAFYRMVGGIAHDFNNLLTGIIGYSELARELKAGETEKLKKYLQQIDISGNKAKSLIQKLLTFSQDNQSKLVLGSPQHVINESIDMLRDSFPPTIELVTDIEEGLPQVMMDNTHLYQCIINLGLNARDAMHEVGKLTISAQKVKLDAQTCSSCLDDFSGDFLELAVKDTGKGISSKDLPHVFDPFYTTHEMATGLGLSVVHGIIHEHHGHVQIESQSNSGTTVRLYIPLLRD